MIPATTTLPLVPEGATTTVEGDSVEVPHGSATTTDVANPEYATLDMFFSAYRDQFAFEVATTTLMIENGQVYATTTVVTELRLPPWLERLASSTGFLGAEQIRERNGIVTWLEDGVVHAMWGSVNNLPPHFFCDIECHERISLDWQEPIRHYEFYPNRNDVLVVLTEKGLFAVELDDRGGRTIIPLYENFEDPMGASFRVRNGTAIVVRDAGYFFEWLLP